MNCEIIERKYWFEKGYSPNRLLISFRYQKNRNVWANRRKFAWHWRLYGIMHSKYTLRITLKSDKGMITRLRGLSILQNLKSIMSSYWIRRHSNLGKRDPSSAKMFRISRSSPFGIFWVISSAAVQLTNQNHCSRKIQRSKVKHLLKLIEKTIFKV
jgi:hypothetical protein